jgi:hypothetical protein
VKDYEQYASTLADLHLIASVCIMLKQAALLAQLYNTLQLARSEVAANRWRQIALSRDVGGVEFS